jgi:hypothetical protein
MKAFAFFALTVSTLALAGCENKPAPKPPAKTGGIEINAPGVKVDVEPGKGVEVKAPGVEVDAKKVE